MRYTGCATSGEFPLGKPIVLIAALLGVICLVVAVIYFAMPADSLPSFFPGAAAGDAGHHYKHGIGALVVALVLFAFAWFQSTPKAAA